MINFLMGLFVILFFIFVIVVVCWILNEIRAEGGR